MRLNPYLTLIPFSAGSLFFAQGKDLAPSFWLEDIARSDASIQKCLVFRSVAGVDYTVEGSSDLIQWTTESALYGLGHEFVVPVLEVSPPEGSANPQNPPPPRPRPPRPKLVSIWMQRSSAPGGGTILSWISLANQMPVQVMIAGSLSPDWAAMPHYCQRFGDYEFFVKHPSSAAAPPASSSSLGTLDAAMLASFEDHLDEMNAEVEASVANARNSPPPSPPSPDSRKFYRIRANWDRDSDMDGSPDWLEFEIAADPTHPFHGTANPFSNDADNDGNPDQLDADGDGIPDGWDADREKSAIDWNKTTEPRFAWFEFQAPMSPQGYPQIPLHVTDLGYVVFPYGLWSKGSYSSMAMEGNGMSSCTIRGMNNSWGGQIIGHGAFDEDGDGNPDRTCHAYWGSPTGQPQPVRAGNNFASLRYPNIDNPSRLLANDGGFIAIQSTNSAPARWLFPTLGEESFQVSPTQEWAQLGSSANFIWGGDKAMIGEELTILPNYYREIVATPSGSIVACKAGDPPAVYKNDNWQVEASLPHWMDFSYKGFGVTFSPVQIWSNGRSMPLQMAAPGLNEDWSKKARLIDMSDEGNLLVAKDAPNSEGADAYALGVPIMVEDDVPASGVDNVSCTSRDPGIGIDDKIWIMAPSGGKNTVRFRTTAASASCPLAISTPSATFAPYTLENPNQIVEVGGGVAPVSGDSDLRIFNNGMAPLSWPIGIKVMKKRIVRVAVYKVNKDLGNGGINPPDLVPEGNEQLKAYLDKVFSPQINVSFNVDIKEASLTAAWDLNNDRTFNVGSADTHSLEQMEVIEKIPNLSEGEIAPHIQIFLMAGGIPIDGDAVGATNQVARTCWIMGESYRYHNTSTALMRTIAHEIGHIFVGYGHPDEGSGASPLPGTRHIDRLMVTGEKRSGGGGELLVKREWDAAEEELSKIFQIRP